MYSEVHELFGVMRPGPDSVEVSQIQTTASMLTQEIKHTAAYICFIELSTMT